MSNTLHYGSVSEQNLMVVTFILYFQNSEGGVSGGSHVVVTIGSVVKASDQVYSHCERR